MRVQRERTGKGDAYRLTGEINGDGELANRYLKALEVKGLSAHSIRAYAYDLAFLLKWLGSRSKAFQDLDQAEIIDFIAAQRDAAAHPLTINRRLITCRTFFRFAFDKEIPKATGALQGTPYYRGRGYDRQLGLFWLGKARSIHLKVNVPRKVIEPLTVAEVNAFCKALSRYRDRAIALLMLLCGLRSCEILSLRVSDVNLYDLHMRTRGKGGKERTMPMPAALAPIIRKYLKLERPADSPTPTLFLVMQGARRGQPMTAAGLRSLFRHRRLTRGLKKANAHRFRHTFGADMARSGVQLPVLQRMMGHADAQTTLRYIELSLADVADEYRQAIEKLKGRYGDLQ